jgi:hypothetical protein
VNPCLDSEICIIFRSPLPLSLSSSPFPNIRHISNLVNKVAEIAKRESKKRTAWISLFSLVYSTYFVYHVKVQLYLEKYDTLKSCTFSFHDENKLNQTSKNNEVAWLLEFLYQLLDKSCNLHELTVYAQK